MWQILAVRATVFFTLILLLSACTQYDVSVNDRVVYTPKPLFSHYAIADKHLADCVAQTISDQKITNPKDLTRLRCSHAGIESLAGLATFDGLTQLDLSDNHIKHLDALKKLSKLRVVLLPNNALTQLSPLLRLLHLAQLDISGNKKASCRDVTQIAAVIHHNHGSIVKPAHCQ